MSALHQVFLSLGASKSMPQIYPRSSFFPPQIPSCTVGYSSYIHSCFPKSLSFADNGTRRFQQCAAAHKSAPGANFESDPNSKSGTKRKGRPRKRKDSQTELSNAAETPPTTLPRKRKRGRKSEVEAVEDFVRNSLEKTFSSIRDQNPEVFINKKQILKTGNDSADSAVSPEDDDDNYDDLDDSQTDQEMAVEEDDPNWPVDADVGWGIRASDYFEKHAIKNVVGDDGFEIDWEGEIDNSWVQEINCLEWENYAFHPSPLIVLVFERYNRATENWKLLKELEKALQVYWNAKNRLPPRAVKLDTNIEKDLAYALKVKQCPQILFLLGQRILYREKELRNSEELVQMIAYFYYKAKKPSWINDAALSL